MAASSLNARFVVLSQIQTDAEFKRFTADGDVFWRGSESFQAFHDRKAGRVAGVPTIGFAHSMPGNTRHRGTLVSPQTKSSLVLCLAAAVCYPC